MAEKSYLHRKRIVYTALTPYVTGHNLMRCMILWEKKYAQSPSNAVKHYVYDIKNSISPEVDVRNVHMNLIRCASEPENKLLGDPSALINKFAREYELDVSHEFTLPELEVLQLFINKWLGLLKGPDKIGITGYVSENIAVLGIDPTLGMHFSGWIAGNFENIKLPQVKTSDLRKIINLFYIACCEFVGPVAADQMLETVVTRLKNNGGASYKTLIDNLL